MLVLSRMTNEKIIVNGPCVITVVHADGLRLKLGFDAPPTTRIWREEVMKRIEAKDANAKTADATERQPDGTPRDTDERAAVA
jgi:carbon storage regulator